MNADCIDDSMAVASFRLIRKAAATAIGVDARPVEDLVEAPEVRELSLGSQPAARVRDALLDDSRFLELEGGEWIHLPSLLDGTTWTTRMPVPPPSDDRIPAEPDLALLAWWAIAEPIPLAGGGALDAVELEDGRDGLEGPPGWLEPNGGSTLACAISDGRVTLRGAEPEPTATADQIAAVRVAFTVVADGEAGDLVTALVEDVLVEALVVGRDAFLTTVIPPVDELLAAADLERDGAEVAGAGFDWDALHVRQEERRVGVRHQLDEIQTAGLVAVLGASYVFEAGDLTDEPSSARALAALLSDPDVARAFLSEHQGRGTDSQTLVAFARRILDHERATEARDLVAALLPDALLEDDDVRELEELLADVDDESLPSPSPRAPDDPALAAALDEFVRDRERRWVDEPVPMLGGLTPREAALDPIGRVELERLLRQYEDRSGTPGTFDVARLRQLLDLP